MAEEEPRLGADLDEVGDGAELREGLGLVEEDVLRWGLGGGRSFGGVPGIAAARALVLVLGDGAEVRVGAAEPGEGQGGGGGVEAGGEWVVAEEIGGGKFGGGVVALEDEAVVGEGCAADEALADEAEDEGAEAAVDGGEGEEVGGAEEVEDGEEDLVGASVLSLFEVENWGATSFGMELIEASESMASSNQGGGSGDEVDFGSEREL